MKEIRRKTGKQKPALPNRSEGPAHVWARARSLHARRSPSQERSRQTVDAIVEAAGRLLVEHGRQGVTTNAVAKRAGVSIGSVYQYFPNKESIFEALQERHREQVAPLIQHTLARLGDPAVGVVDALLGLVRAMTQLHAASPARLRALSEELHEEASADQIQALTETTTEILATRFGRPPDAVRPTAWLASLTLTHLGRTLVHHPPAIDADPLLAVVERMLRGLFGEFA